jgi:FADH2-dependent halogenase
MVRELAGENNFEYHCATLAGPGFFIVGDSGCFTYPTPETAGTSEESKA